MLSHRNLMAMTVSHLADFDCTRRELQLCVHGAPMSHGSGLYIPPYVLRGAARWCPQSVGVRTRRVPRPVRSPSRLQRFPRPDHGAAAGADRTAAAAQPEDGGLRRRPDVRRQPQEGDGGVRPDLRAAVRPGRGTDDDHRPSARPTTSSADDATLGSVGYARSGVDVAVVGADGTARWRSTRSARSSAAVTSSCPATGTTPTPRRPRCRTAGCAPATWARSTRAGS